MVAKRRRTTMADVKVVQVTVWLGDEQTTEVVAGENEFVDGQIVQPCNPGDAMGFSRSGGAKDLVDLLEDLFDKLIRAVQNKAQSVTIRNQGTKIIRPPVSAASQNG